MRNPALSTYETHNSLNHEPHTVGGAERQHVKIEAEDSYERNDVFNGDAVKEEESEFD